MSNTVKVRALRPLQFVGRTVHPCESMRMSVEEAAQRVADGDAEYLPGFEPKAEPKAKAEK